MREILFRGQIRKKGQKVDMAGEKLPGIWVYGGVLQGVGCHSIIYGGKNENDLTDGLDKWVVYTDTLGQFTGMTDKNGTKIFEGDIIKSYDPDYPESKMDCGIGQVEFYAGLWYVSGEVHNSLYDLCTICCLELEVLGNIHDNPELLEKGGT